MMLLTLITVLSDRVYCQSTISALISVGTSSLISEPDLSDNYQTISKPDVSWQSEISWRYKLDSLFYTDIGVMYTQFYGDFQSHLKTVNPNGEILASSEFYVKNSLRTFSVPVLFEVRFKGIIVGIGGRVQYNFQAKQNHSTYVFDHSKLVYHDSDENEFHGSIKKFNVGPEFRAGYQIKTFEFGGQFYYTEIKSKRNDPVWKVYQTTVYLRYNFKLGR